MQLGLHNQVLLPYNSTVDRTTAAADVLEALLGAIALATDVAQADMFYTQHCLPLDPQTLFDMNSNIYSQEITKPPLSM